nr:unnamed protein product [Callosobruchus analis]
MDFHFCGHELSIDLYQIKTPCYINNLESCMSSTDSFSAKNAFDNGDSHKMYQMCKDYRKTQLKQSLWKKIAQILGITDNECSKRWGYVRDYYIKRRGKPSTGSCGEAAKKRSHQLSFLDSISSGKRSTLSNIGHSESQESVANSTAHYSEEGNDMEQQQFELLTADDTSSTIPHIQEAEDKILKTARVTKRKCTTTSTSADERLQILKQIAAKQDEKKMKQDDENDLFFAAMAKITKKLPKVVQAKLRMDIGNLVGNAEIEHISVLPSHEYGHGPSSGRSSTSYSTFLTDDSTPTEASASLLMAERSETCFINI